jgi:hypothetical protein
MVCWPGTLASDQGPYKAASLRAAMAEIGARQAALRCAHRRHHLSALDVLTPERVRKSSELRGYGGSHTHRRYRSRPGHIGGLIPSFSRVAPVADTEPSGLRRRKMKIAAPGFTRLMSPGTKATTGTSGGTGESLQASVRIGSVAGRPQPLHLRSDLALRGLSMLRRLTMCSEQLESALGSKAM